MWINNKDVRYVYSTNNSKAVFAILDGVAGWKRVKPDSNDGVTNMATLLSAANSNNRKVNVFMDDDNITRAMIV